jgi:hypothetical protein
MISFLHPSGINNAKKIIIKNNIAKNIELEIVITNGIKIQLIILLHIKIITIQKTQYNSIKENDFKKFVAFAIFSFKVRTILLQTIILLLIFIAASIHDCTHYI